MEKLKASVILDALNTLKKPETETIHTEKAIQETIYQIEDINAEKAFIKNYSNRKRSIDCSVNASDFPRLFNCHTSDKKFIINIANGVNKTVSDVNIYIMSSGRTNKEKTEIITSILMNWIYANGSVIESKVLKNYIKMLKDVEKDAKLSETPATS